MSAVIPERHSSIGHNEVTYGLNVFTVGRSHENGGMKTRSIEAVIPSPARVDLVNFRTRRTTEDAQPALKIEFDSHQLTMTSEMELVATVRTSL